MRESVRLPLSCWTFLLWSGVAIQQYLSFIPMVEGFPGGLVGGLSFIEQDDLPFFETDFSIFESESGHHDGRIIRREAPGGDDGDAPEDPYLEVLEKLGAQLDPKWFSAKGDRLVRQKLDRINDISKYLDAKNNETVIFERQKLDAKKEAVVLSSSEDRRGVNASMRKRTYTVLRKSPGNDTKNSLFYLVFAYVRDARESDKPSDLVEVNGNKVSVEWDVWEERSGSKFNIGWTTCAYSVLFACSFNTTAVEMVIDKKVLDAVSEAVTEPPTATTTAAPPTTSAVSSSTSSPTGEAFSTTLEKAKTADGFDPDEYTDLYGDFDLGEKKQGRSVLGSFGSWFGGSSDAAPEPTKTITKTVVKKKIIRVVKNQQPSVTPVSGSIGSQLLKSGGGSFSNADTIFGTYYQGLKGTPPIFLPDQARAPALFIPDSSQFAFSLHGIFIPGSVGYPDSFIADEPAQAKSMISVPGTMIPDGMTMAGVTGGVHGKLSGDSFRPDSLGTSMWFNPDGPDSKKIWAMLNRAADTPKRAKLSDDGQTIVYGTSFPGVSGSPDIFIPEGVSIPGYFVPNDPTKPDVTKIPHGMFVATKPAGHGAFYPDNAKELVNIDQIRGAFMPDGMNLTGAISGLATRDVANSYIFVVDVPGLDFDYWKGKADTANMWTPFLAPGEFKPPATTTPRPMGDAPVIATPKPGAPPKVVPKNLAFMYGARFPGMGTLDIFVPDNYPVDGIMIPQDSEYKQISGDLSANGKNTNQKISFKPDEGVPIDKLPPTLYVIFEPVGIAPGNGVIGELGCDQASRVCTFFSEPASKGYWYIKGKPENDKVWTPFLPPVNPILPKATILDKVQSQKFFMGLYFPGIPGEDPVFIPEDGAIGCFSPDNAPAAKTCGSFYPDRPGVPSSFIISSGQLMDGTTGTYIPDLQSGNQSVLKFHGTFENRPPVPMTLIPDLAPIQGWSHSDVKIPQAQLVTTTPAPGDKPTNVAIGVGGGFSGYPTNGKGIEALIDPNSPIFKEFLQWKSRKDKSIESNERIVIVNTNEKLINIQNSGTTKKGTSYVALDEYKAYVDERYAIKSTNVEGELLEIAVPKAADRYLKKKKKNKGPLSININVNSNANAGAGAGAGGGGGGGGGNSGTGSAGGGVTGTSGGKKCGGRFSSSASATAVAVNGSEANADAHAKNGGNANAVSKAKDGAIANSKANVTEGGMANALSLAKDGANASTDAEALKGGMANAVVKLSNNTSGKATAEAQRLDNSDETGCEGGGLPEEIEVDSHAAATALNNGTGGGGNVVNSVANTNVKIDMGSLLSKIQEMQKKRAESDDDDEDDGVININVNTDAKAGAGAASGRSIGDEEDSEAKAAALLKPGLKLRAGWKTEFKIIVPNCTLDYENEVFYGLGSCPFTGSPDPEGAIKNGGDPERLIDFYLQVLRMDCTKNVKSRIQKLIASSWLDFSQDFDYFTFNSNNPEVAQAKLPDETIRRLSAAYELHIFSRTYIEQVKASDSTAIGPYLSQADGSAATVSRSVRFFTEFCLNFIEASRKVVPTHYVRLTRNILNTLKTLMTKLYQDGMLLEKCPECTVDRELNHNDQLQTMGLLELFVHGLAPYEKEQVKDIRAVFTDFVKLNRPWLEDKVKEYQTSFPK